MPTSFDSLLRWRHLFLLIALLALLVVQPIASAFGLMTTLFNALFAVVMVTLVVALAGDSRWRIVAAAFLIAVTSLAFGGRFLSSAAEAVSVSAGYAIGALFFAAVAGKIVYSVFKSRRLSLDSLCGAVCGYLLLGLAWALTYDMIYAARPDSFAIAPATLQEIQESGASRHLFVYYSFVTLTTVGYGDVTPISLPARTLSWFEAMTGQLYLTVLIAGLISALAAARPARGNSVHPAGDA